MALGGDAGLLVVTEGKKVLAGGSSASIDEPLL